MSIEAGFIVFLLIVTTSVPFIRRNFGTHAALTTVAAEGILTTLFLAVYRPNSISDGAAGSWTEFLGLILDFTHGKWPLVGVFTAVTLVLATLSVRLRPAPQ